MDTEQVKRVVDMVERSQLHEVTIVDGAQSITVVNKSKATNSDNRGFQNFVRLYYLSEIQFPIFV